MISSIEMVNGGVIRMALGSKSSQNRISPSSWHLKITWFVRSAEGVIAAKINPFPFISLIS
jgi:hypothetical protein